MIDFFEIQNPHRWEQFAEAFFIARGAIILHRASVGPDGGADLIIQQVEEVNGVASNFKILVSCKFSSKSIGTAIEQDISDRIITHDCAGFYGFYSTDYTTALQKKLHSIKENTKNQMVFFHIFDNFEIEDFLKNNLENNLFENYFEKSFKSFIGNTKNILEENTNFNKLTREQLRDEGKSDFRSYFLGESPQWSFVRKYTFNRDVFEQVIFKLDKSKIVLITGAGGEGKSTLLMQLGRHYFEKNYEVYYAFDGISSINIATLKFNKSKNYLLLIDQANYIQNILAFIKAIKLKSNVKLILGSRKNEWIHFIESSGNFKDFQILLGRDEITLSKLSTAEIKKLETLLLKYDIIHEDSKNNFHQALTNESERTFLLAVMIFATKGKTFEYYIADVINNIRTWNGGEESLKAIAYVVAIEVMGNFGRTPTYCPERLLVNLLEISAGDFYSIKKNLSQEAFFNEDASRLIHTRNSNIAKVYFDLLFRSDPSMFSVLEFYTSIIHCSGLLDNLQTRKILSVLPLHLHGIKLFEFAKQCLQLIATYGIFSRRFIVFVDYELKNNNVGTYESYSARWLCYMGCEKEPTYGGFYIKWAEIEQEFGDVGDFKTRYSARWILKLAYDRKIIHRLFFITWAKLEIRLNNLGNSDCQTEFSARWLLSVGFTRFLTADITLLWADLENKEKNFGDLTECEENTVRWIFRVAHQRNQTLNIYQEWAAFEISRGNYGESLPFRKFSARWILKEGLQHTRNLNLYYSWAKLEIKLRNFGEQECKTPYTVRWLLKEGFSKEPLAIICFLWVKIEVKKKNYGDINASTPYSARWILNNAIERTMDLDLRKSLQLYWAKLESKLKNYGAYTTPFSALYLLKNLYKVDMINEGGLLVWSAIQFYTNVPENDDFSSKTLFELAKRKKTKIHFQKAIFHSHSEWEDYLKTESAEKVFRAASLSFDEIPSPSKSSF